MADIEILKPEARRLVVVRRPDAPVQTKVPVRVDARARDSGGNRETVEAEFKSSKDLGILVQIASGLVKDAAWKTDFAATKTAAESLLAKHYSPATGGSVVIAKTPAFQPKVLALAGAALWLARQGRPIRSSPYLDAVFVDWLFRTVTDPKSVPSKTRDGVVFVWDFSPIANPDVVLRSRRDAAPERVADLRREAVFTRNFINEFYPTAASRTSALSASALAALSANAPKLAEHFARTKTIAEALAVSETVLSAQPTPETAEPQLVGVHVGDLYVTRTRMAGYQIADISRIETVLGGESRERNHTRRTLSETTESVEDEQERETETDLQQTSRDEVRTEQRKQEEQETQASGGGRVTASFGTFMTAEAHADVSTKSSKSVAETVARTTSQETTRKAVDRARSKILRRLSTHTLEEVIEQNRHTLTSKMDKQGFYRWLEKRVEVTLLTLGSRTIYTFSVDDPSAAFRASSASSMPAPPQPPMYAPKVQFPFNIPGFWTPPRPLKPADIGRDTYLDLLSENEAGDGQPPPPEFQTMSIAVAAATKDGSASEKDVDLPEGYECSQLEARIVGQVFKYTDDQQSDKTDRQKDVEAQNGDALVRWFPHEGEVTTHKTSHTQPARTGAPVADAVIAGHTFHDAQTLSLGPNQLQSPLGPRITMAVRSLGDVALEATFFCRLRTEVFERWQLDTYRAIMAGYAVRLGRYQEAVAALTRTSIEIAALRAEMRRLALRGVLRGANPPAAVRLFLEQAFDWENIAYQFIEGENMGPRTLPGSALAAFLRAVVARIDLAVRPGFEGLAAAYMQGPPTVVPDNPVSEEGGTGLDAALEAPITAPLSGTPVTSWTELLPTELIFVQKDTDVTDIYDDKGNQWKASNA